MSKPAPTRPAKPIGDAARSESLAATLAAKPYSGPVRVFAYGSLLWDPCFDYEAKAVARLVGWVRRTCLWSLHARGSPEQPGLFYGLDTDPGGFCDGAVFTLSESSLTESLERLWRREVHTAVYRPRWLSVETGGGPVPAIAFVVDPAHPLHAGAIDPETAAGIIARAHGTFGSCADYYRETVAALKSLGVEDRALFDLVDLIGPAASRWVRAARPNRTADDRANARPRDAG